MNIYEKLAVLRVALADNGLKKGGNNTHMQRKYFELDDFIPTLLRLEKEQGLFSVVSFGVDVASLTYTNTEMPHEQLTITSPMSTADLKGVHAVQNLGAVQTYLRRYLYMAMLNITESDELDRTLVPEKRAEETTKSVQNRDWVAAAKSAKLMSELAPSTLKSAQIAALTRAVATPDGLKKDPDKAARLHQIISDMGYASVRDVGQADYAEVVRRFGEGKA